MLRVAFNPWFRMIMPCYDSASWQRRVGDPTPSFNDKKMRTYKKGRQGRRVSAIEGGKKLRRKIFGATGCPSLPLRGTLIKIKS